MAKYLHIQIQLIMKDKLQIFLNRWISYQDEDDVTKNIKFKPQEKFKEKLLIHLLTREFQSLLCEIF
jgi:hypothetical protein